MKIIVGLGNPGEKYKKTRHNIGFIAVDILASRMGLSWQMNKKFNSEVAKEGETILIKPLTFMNNSGQAVQAILSYYKLLPKKLGLIKQKDSDLSENLYVVHDDVDIELGKHKISINSRSGGHNGVQSIINHLKTKNFKRIRIGVKTELINKIPTDKFVLQRFNEEEINTINILIPEVLEELK